MSGAPFQWPGDWPTSREDSAHQSEVDGESKFSWPEIGRAIVRLTAVDGNEDGRLFQWPEIGRA